MHETVFSIGCRPIFNFQNILMLCVSTEMTILIVLLNYLCFGVSLILIIIQIIFVL